MFLLRPKTVKKGHQRVCQQYLLLPLLLLLLIALLIALLPHYQVDRAVWAGWQLWRPFLFLLGPKQSKRVTKGSVSSTYYYRCYYLLLIALLPRFYRPFLFLPVNQDLPKGLSTAPITTALLLIPLLPRVHGTYQLYLDRALSGRLAALATLFVPPEAQNGQKGSPKSLSAVPTITAATTATNFFTICFTTTPCSLGRLAALATLFVPPGAQNDQKGSPKSLSAVPTITAATTATNCFTTTLSWNRPDLRTLFVPPLLPRFHGTYQVYLDRAVSAGWQLWRPYLFLLRPKMVKKGHQRVCQQYLLLPLLLLLLIALLPRFHGTYQVYHRAVWAGWQLWRPFLLFLKTVKKGYQRVCQQ